MIINSASTPAVDEAATRSLSRLGEDWRRPLRPNERACCCPAYPQVKVVIPANHDRHHPTELLLCNHHFHASRRALTQIGAAVYDAAGALME